MVSEKLEKLTASIELLREGYLSLKAERDSLRNELRELEELRTKAGVLEAERVKAREKVDLLLKSVERLSLGEKF